MKRALFQLPIPVRFSSAMSFAARGWKSAVAGLLPILALAGGLQSASTFAASTSLPQETAPPSDDLEFESNFLRTDPKQTVDLSRFSKGNRLSPGIYLIDIQVNGVRVAHRDVRFIAAGKDLPVLPCLSRKELENFGIDLTRAGLVFETKMGGDATAQSSTTPVQNAECLDFSGTALENMSAFDFSEQRLELTVPQMYMRSVARGYVSPDLWEQGVNAGWVNYNASAYRNSSGGMSSTQSYLGLDVGLSLAGWHLRHQSSLQAMSGQKTQTDTIATYVQHDLPTLQSQLVLGDSNTTGDVFDSVAFRGVQVATDDRMLPDSLRGYAPTVRGTAETNARVTIRQNGQVIYETTVTPGAFEIKDLYATGYGGNLDVTVTEADGRAKSYTVPYAALAQSLRPGVTRFSATAGQLRGTFFGEAPNFAQFTLQRGLSNLVTAYGGGVAANGYMAGSVGAALNTRYGAFAADVTGAQTQLPGQGTQTGNSARLSYSKFVDPTNTSITLAAYRYSTSGYLGLSDAATMRDLILRNADASSLQRARNRLQLSLNQDLGSYGSAFLSGSSQQYWGRKGSETYFQAGYSNSFKSLSYSLSLGRTRMADGQPSTEFMASLMIPFGPATSPMMVSTNLTHNTNGSDNIQTTVSGSAGDAGQYSYSGYGSYVNASGVSTSAGLGGAWRGPVAQLSATASTTGSNSNQLSASIAGSIVAHPGGVTFSEPVGDTFGVIEAQGAAGAAVTSSPGIKIDGFGYAVVPLTPYYLNSITIDPKGTSTDVEFKSTTEIAVPRLGAVSLVSYKMANGRAALIHAPRVDGSTLPFGEDVVDAQGHTVGVVGQDSQIFARGVQEKGTLFVRLAGEPAQQCRIDYELPAPAKTTGKPGGAYTLVEAPCIPADSSNVPNSNGVAEGISGATTPTPSKG